MAQFVFGETPAQAARMGLDIAERNRAATLRAAEQEAAYAYQNNAIANQNALRFAQMLNQRQEQENALAREAESLGERRYLLGQQAQAGRDDAARRRFEFGTGQKNIERQFKFAEQEASGKRQEKEEEVENIGLSLAGAIAQLKPANDSAEARLNTAEKELAGLFSLATGRGLKFNQRAERFEGASSELSSFNQELVKRQAALDAAGVAYEPVAIRLSDIEKQARKFGFVVEPDGIRDVRRGKLYPVAPAAPRPSPWTPGNITAPMSTGGVGAGADDRGAPASPLAPARTAPGYQAGRVYGGLRFEGGDPNNAANWKRVR